MIESGQKVQDALKEFIKEVDKFRLREVQRRMHLCAANCHADNHADVDQVHNCVERCKYPAQRAQIYVQSKLEHFQINLSHCVLQCQNVLNDSRGNTDEAEVIKGKNDLEMCANACCDENIQKLPIMMKKLKETFESIAL